MPAMYRRHQGHASGQNMKPNGTPVNVVAPGSFLRDELVARGCSADELSALMGLPESDILELIDGKKEITGEIANGLAAALGTSVELWVNLEAGYRRALAKERERSGVALSGKRITIYLNAKRLKLLGPFDAAKRIYALIDDMGKAVEELGGPAPGPSRELDGTPVQVDEDPVVSVVCRQCGARNFGVAKCAICGKKLQP